MSYLVLARKWRPRRFAELVGQQHVVRALVNGIETGRLHHAFLFTGTRGVGKTTIARILAKALNCETGITAEPCGVCSACKDIDAGRFVDLLEIDAASRTKVDDTRDLLDNVIYAPSRGRYKVYLIDEVHMLSTHSFNALLKTLEEPPPHVKFLLATTDPQKLPVTVLSRCLQFSLKRLERVEIEGQLQRILEAEQISFEGPALTALSRAADGSLRDGLSLLDQALAFGNGSVRSDDVLAMLGSIDRRALGALANALMQDDREQLRAELKRISELSVDYAGLLAELLVLWHDVAVYQGLGQDIESEMVDNATLASLAAGLSPEDVQLFYQLTLTSRRDLDLAPDQRSGFEMAMLRLLAFRPATTTPLAPAPPRPQGVAPTPTRPGAAPVASVPPPNRPAPPAAVATAPRPAPPAYAATAPVRPTPVNDAIETQPVPAGGEWHDTMAGLNLRGPAQQLAAQLKLVEQQGSRWKLALAPNAESLNTPLARQWFEEAMRKRLGDDVSIEIIVRALDGGETPAERDARARSERLARTEQTLMADPGLQSLTREFGARVLPGSLKVEP